MENMPKVVIIGAGFAGLWAAKTLSKEKIQALVIDRNNFHTFHPLLYQVATAGIEPEAICYPVRGILQDLPGIQFMLSVVTRINPDKRCITTTSGDIPYDYLIIATGSVTAYFNVPGAQEHAFSLKNIDEAVHLRNHILCCFERAAHEKDIARRKALLTFAVVGGGATGVEFAGALAELINGPVLKDYPEINRDEASVILVEYAKNVLNGLPEKLSRYTLDQLRRLRVIVELGQQVTSVSPEGLTLGGNRRIAAKTTAWLAGVRGQAPLSPFPARPHDERLAVNTALQADGSSNIFVIGDLAFPDAQTAGNPMVAPAAIQQGEAAAQNILRLIRGEQPKPYVYQDKGAMVTIGRNAAVVRTGSFAFTGFIAWLLWLLLHLYKLIGFRNRLMILINWAWDYFFSDRAIRVILPSCRGFECHHTTRH